MAKVKDVSNGGLRFKCPGCGVNHVVNITGAKHVRWSFDGNYERPTLSPSVLVNGYLPSDDPSKFDDPLQDVPFTCHSFVRNGYIEFLTDCTHQLAGQTVALPDIES